MGAASSNDRSEHILHSRMTSVRGTKLIVTGWDFAETMALLDIFGGC